jgi:hypothetical protein
MKIGFIVRDVSESSPLGRWTIALAKAAADRGDEPHVIAERVSAGQVASAGGQAHIVSPVKNGGAFGRWIFARRAKREIKAEPLDLLISAGEIPDPDLLLVPDSPTAGPSQKTLRKALKRANFKKAVVPSDAVKAAVVEQYGVPSERVVVAGPPAPNAPAAEWTNRAIAFWSAVA